MEIKAFDLSEDMSVLSTKNDEILIILYEQIDSINFSEPLVGKRLLFDSNNLIRSFDFPVKRELTNANLVLFLIELDYETPVEQIDPVIRIHHREITKAFFNMDRSSIEKYLGSEDILGIQKITELPTDFYLSGVYKLDRYEYQISIELVE